MAHHGVYDMDNGTEHAFDGLGSSDQESQAQVFDVKANF